MQNLTGRKTPKCLQHSWNSGLNKGSGFEERKNVLLEKWNSPNNCALLLTSAESQRERVCAVVGSCQAADKLLDLFNFNLASTFSNIVNAKNHQSFRWKVLLFWYAPRLAFYNGMFDPGLQPWTTSENVLPASPAGLGVRARTSLPRRVGTLANHQGQGPVCKEKVSCPLF